MQRRCLAHNVYTSNSLRSFASPRVNLFWTIPATPVYYPGSQIFERDCVSVSLSRISKDPTLALYNRIARKCFSIAWPRLCGLTIEP